VRQLLHQARPSCIAWHAAAVLHPCADVHGCWCGQPLEPAAGLAWAAPAGAAQGQRRPAHEGLAAGGPHAAAAGGRRTHSRGGRQAGVGIALPYTAVSLPLAFHAVLCGPCCVPAVDGGGAHQAAWGAQQHQQAAALHLVQAEEQRAMQQTAAAQEQELADLREQVSRPRRWPRHNMHAAHHLACHTPPCMPHTIALRSWSARIGV